MVNEVVDEDVAKELNKEVVKKLCEIIQMSYLNCHLANLASSLIPPSSNPLIKAFFDCAL